MSPDFFMDRASLSDVELFLEGKSDADRESWEKLRIQCFITAKVGGCEAEDVYEFWPFSWDADTSDAPIEINENELKELRQKAAEIEKSLKI